MIAPDRRSSWIVAMVRFRSVGNARCLGLHDPASIDLRRRLTTTISL